MSPLDDPKGVGPVAERLIGHVTHWYGGIQVAGIHVDEGELHVGDTVHIVGHTSDLMQRIDSIEIEHHEVPEVRAGEDVGVRVSDHVREHDRIFVVH